MNARQALFQLSCIPDKHRVLKGDNLLQLYRITQDGTERTRWGGLLRQSWGTTSLCLMLPTPNSSGSFLYRVIIPTSSCTLMFRCWVTTGSKLIDLPKFLEKGLWNYLDNIYQVNIQIVKDSVIISETSSVEALFDTCWFSTERWEAGTQAGI